MIGGVTHLSGLPGLPGRVTLSAGVAFCHVNVWRWGNPPSRGQHLSVTDKKTARFILKFFFRSLSVKIQLYKLSHHCSALPEFLHILPWWQLILLWILRSHATAAFYCCIARAVKCLWWRLCIIKKEQQKATALKHQQQEQLVKGKEHWPPKRVVRPRFCLSHNNL